MSDEPTAHPTSSLSTLAELMAMRRGERTIAVAESFTSGLLAQAIAAVEHSSEWFCGGIVCYQERSKREVLGVEAPSVVEEDAAEQMALGVRQLFGADAAVATTGVAGPSTQDNRPPGTVVIGWSVGAEVGSETLRFPGEPEQVMQRGVRAALTRLTWALTEVQTTERTPADATPEHGEQPRAASDSDSPGLALSLGLAAPEPNEPG